MARGAIGAGSAFAQPNSTTPNALAEDLYHRTEYQFSLKMLDRGSSDPAIANLIGRNYYMLGDFKKATEYFQKAVNQAPDSATMLYG